MVGNLAFEGLNKILFDKNLKAKKAVAWCINRIASGRDGV